MFLPRFGANWKEKLPKGIFGGPDSERFDEFDTDTDISVFFDEFTLLNLKEIVKFDNTLSYCKPFFGEIGAQRFDDQMNQLNQYRKKIAHSKLSFSFQDFQEIIDLVRKLCQGPESKSIVQYLENEGYKSADEIPSSFFEEFECPNNLPSEDFDLDGGFVGRRKEIQDLKKILFSNQDRILSIVGAGGVGKTATALKMCYDVLSDFDNPFTAIMWFSAKEDKLTDAGIIKLTSGIQNDMQLLREIASLINSEGAKALEDAKSQVVSYRNFLYSRFSKERNLIIIDNLETIFYDNAIINFIKDIPRPSQVLITSRKGLGEIERRYPLSDLSDSDAMILFRLISKERNRPDLLRFSDAKIKELCNRVRNYPLLIKWSIGQVCLGKDIEKSFSDIHEGESAIDQFVFNDVFNLLSEDSKIILYSMAVYGEKPIQRPFLMHLSDLNEDEFDSAIRELQLSSFVIPGTAEKDGRIETMFSMLDLTRGFVNSQLREDQETFQQLNTRYYDLSQQIHGEESAKQAYFQSFFSIGAKTESDQLSFMHVKSAKNYTAQDKPELAEKEFREALKISPDFSYMLTEYSKFEYSRNNINRAVALMKRAVSVDPVNFHAQLHYGKLLRKTQNLKESIRILEKAKAINPKYLPINNELGRSYTFIGDYDKAEEEFTTALQEQKYPNYRHKLITLLYLADNHIKKAEAFLHRRDNERGVSSYFKAIEICNEALEISPPDLKIINTRTKAYIFLGSALCEDSKVDRGLEFLRNAIEPYKIGNRTIEPPDIAICSASYNIVKYTMASGSFDSKEMNRLLKKGRESCGESQNWTRKYDELQKKLNNNGD